MGKPWAVLAVAVAVGGAAEAQGPPPGATRPAATVTAVAVYQAPADLDGGGRLEVTRVRVGGELSQPVGPGRSVSVGAFFEQEAFDFAGGPAPGGGAAPWGTVTRVGASLGVSGPGPGTWRLALRPTVESSREDGAGWGGSATWGGVGLAFRSFGPRLVLGLGLAVRHGLGSTWWFPVPVLRWQVTEGLTLVSGRPGAAAGPAGVELQGQVAPGWELAGGAGYRSSRFRLDGDGPAPGGVGEVRGVPVWGRLTRRFGERGSIDLAAGWVLGGRVELRDDQGHEVARDRGGPAPFAGLSGSVRF